MYTIHSLARVVIAGFIYSWVFAWCVLLSVAQAEEEMLPSRCGLAVEHGSGVSARDFRMDPDLIGLHERTRTVSVLDERLKGQTLYHLRDDLDSEPSSGRTRGSRTRAAHIGSIMALLSTFNEAQMLPAEHDPRANQLIHSLIQLQSVVMKSQSPAFREFVSNALGIAGKHAFETIQADLSKAGLTMPVLESLIDYGATHSPWQEEELRHEFLSYNVQPADWELIQKILFEARQRLARINQTLVDVYARERLEMPGATP